MLLDVLFFSQFSADFQLKFFFVFFFNLAPAYKTAYMVVQVFR